MASKSLMLYLLAHQNRSLMLSGTPTTAVLGERRLLTLGRTRATPFLLSRQGSSGARHCHNNKLSSRYRLRSHFHVKQMRWAPELGNFGRRQQLYWDSTIAMAAAATSLRIDPGDGCGGCLECEESVPGPPGRQEDYAAGLLGPLSDLHIIAIEAAPATFRALSASPLVVSLAAAGVLEVVHAAVTDVVNEAGTMRFLDCDVGLEFCNGNDNGGSPWWYLIKSS
jgi:hypothetical protein